MKVVKLKSICKEFYISSSSLYRIVSQINKVIKKQFQFEISLTPVQLIGNERDIRYFFAQYFQKILFSMNAFENFFIRAPISIVRIGLIRKQAFQ